MTKSRILCGWSGVADDDEQVVGCDRPAVGYVAAPSGSRIYVCDSHVAHAKHDLAGGRYVHGLADSDAVPPTTWHAAVRQARHNASVVGAFE